MAKSPATKTAAQKKSLKCYRLSDDILSACSELSPEDTETDQITSMLAAGIFACDANAARSRSAPGERSNHLLTIQARTTAARIERMWRELARAASAERGPSEPSFADEIDELCRIMDLRAKACLAMVDRREHLTRTRSLVGEHLALSFLMDSPEAIAFACARHGLSDDIKLLLEMADDRGLLKAIALPAIPTTVARAIIPITSRYFVSSERTGGQPDWSAEASFYQDILRRRLSAYAKIEIVDNTLARASVSQAWRDKMLAGAENCAEAHPTLAHTCIVRIDFDALEADYAVREANPDLRLAQ